MVKDNKSSLKSFSVYVIVMLLLVAVDQITKLLIVNDFALYGRKEIIKNFFSLYYVRNTGSAFSFLADVSWGIYILSLISLIMALFIIFLIYKAASLKDFILSLSLSLVAAGAIGNLIDRFRLRYVIDFLRFDFGSYTFPIFNFADMCAVVGTFLVIFLFIFKEKKIDALFQSIGFLKKSEETKETGDDTKS